MILFVVVLLAHSAYVNSVQVIRRDVCIIGGGSTGTYAAVQLHKVKKSVVVVEKESFLGGHTNTYTDPKTNTKVDYGVVVFENIPTVSQYFNYLQIQTTTFKFSFDGITKYVDFTNRQIVNNMIPQDPTTGLYAYLSQVAKYPSLEKGFYLPKPIPEDLLLPFGEFASKYNMTTAVPFILQFGQGIRDILFQPTLYVFKMFHRNMIEKNLAEGFIVTKNNDNSEIYKKAKMLLKKNVLLNSRLVQVVRSINGTEVTIQTPQGCKVIKAKKLLVSIPLKLENLLEFDLRTEETTLFSKFNNSCYYTGLVRNTGLPANVTVANINLRNPYGYPSLPGLYAFRFTPVDELFDFKYGSPYFVSSEQIEEEVKASISMLQQMGIANATGKGAEIVKSNSHCPFELTVSVEDIKKGFYDDLYALQGRYNTFYTGAALHTHNSGLLWEFTDSILARLIKEL